MPCCGIGAAVVAVTIVADDVVGAAATLAVAVGELRSLSGAVSNFAKVGEKVAGLGVCAFVRMPWSNEAVC